MLIDHFNAAIIKKERIFTIIIHQKPLLNFIILKFHLNYFLIN